MTVSILPSFAVPHKHFSSLFISIIFQLTFVCGSSFTGINVQYPSVSRQLAAVWLKNWYYNSTGIINVMISHFNCLRQQVEKCSYHKSKYISEISLEAFFIVSDFVIEKELCSCDGKCGVNSSSCQNRECSVIIKRMQEEFFSNSLNIALL